MQKVVGSNPISRFARKPAPRAGFRASGIGGEGGAQWLVGGPLPNRCPINPWPSEYAMHCSATGQARLDWSMGDQTGAITAVSWVLELPRDLGLPDDTFSSTGVAGDVPPGWEGKLGELPEWPGSSSKGFRDAAYGSVAPMSALACQRRQPTEPSVT